MMVPCVGGLTRLNRKGTVSAAHARAAEFRSIPVEKPFSAQGITSSRSRHATTSDLRKRVSSFAAPMHPTLVIPRESIHDESRVLRVTCKETGDGRVLQHSCRLARLDCVFAVNALGARNAQTESDCNPESDRPSEDHSASPLHFAQLSSSEWNLAFSGASADITHSGDVIRNLQHRNPCVPARPEWKTAFVRRPSGIAGALTLVWNWQLRTVSEYQKLIHTLLAQGWIETDQLKRLIASNAPSRNTAVRAQKAPFTTVTSVRLIGASWILGWRRSQADAYFGTRDSYRTQIRFVILRARFPVSQESVRIASSFLAIELLNLRVQNFHIRFERLGPRKVRHLAPHGSCKREQQDHTPMLECHCHLDAVHES
jgi:hypothetical protein